ncbi:hypothetical protein OEZ85_000223 [Tetradesmus obliquus]|uniref:G8 domain-containing protein n=1 Tax=Tetradesmus obliquus TaxID=3088 RepID=A0ABY8UVB9_TETOB|nr:hypothetical protein OEZ85_000223 [Tetradesmus obliquus]
MATGFSQSSSGSSRRGLPGVLLLNSSALIAGISNGSVGRPAAVQLQAVASGSAAASVVSGRAQVLSVPPGGSLLLQDLLLANATLASPIGNPNTVLLPAGLELPPGALLKLRDVVMVVAQQQLQEYIGFMLSVPQAVIFTDNVSFLHIRNYTNPPFGQVEARSATLIAPEGARINNVPLGVLRAMQPKANSSSSSSSNDAAAAQGDGAGIVTVTDSYVLGANNATLLPLLRRLGGQETQQPLLVLIESNVTLAPAAWGNAWPQGGLKVQRPTVWAGSSWRATSIDFGMEVGQIVLSGRYSNVTLVNVEAENLAYGSAASSQEAEGNSILLSNQLWAFSYRRSVPRVVLWDTVLVLPQQQQIESIIYWVNAFNSDVDFWRNQTRFLRETLQYTVIQYTRGKLPGDYIIITAFKKDQRISNVTYTTRPSAALPLPLPVDPVVHQPLLSSQQETVVGTVRRREGLAVTLWNQRRGSCSRPHVLLMTPPSSSTAGGSTTAGSTDNSTVNLSPAELDLASVASQNAATDADLQNAPGSAASTRAAPGSAAAASTQSDWGVRPNTTLLDPLPAADAISTTWPPPGGQVIECLVEMRGSAVAAAQLPGQQQQQQQVAVDVGYAVGLFRVESNHADGTSSSSQAPTIPGSDAAGSQPLHAPDVVCCQEPHP